MSKRSLYIIIALVLISFSILYFLNSSKSNKNTESSTSLSTNDNSEIKKAEESKINLKTLDNYVEYKSGVIEENKGKKRVLFFFANWCSTCIPVDKEFQEESAKLPEDVVVIRVNYNDDKTDNEEKELAKRYGITYQHTFVQIDEDGNAIVKWNGGGVDNLLEKIK